MKYVLDASVALKTMLNEPGSQQALELIDDFRIHLHELIAPDTLPIEMCHALTRAEHQGVIPKSDGAILFTEFLNDCPTLYPYGDLLDRAMHLSSDMRIGVFDCLYVALAEEERCQVVTADTKMVKQFPDTVISLDSL